MNLSIAVFEIGVGEDRQEARRTSSELISLL